MLTTAQQEALRAPRKIGITSPEFAQGKAIPREFTGHGDDVSPPLDLTGVPHDAQALAIVMDDPDAPGGTFTHWTAWNISPQTTSLERGAQLLAQGRNDFGTTGYRGPKPPSGTHRYYFRVFALDQQLGIPPNAPVDEVWRHLAKHTMAWGELMGTFTRP